MEWGTYKSLKVCRHSQTWDYWSVQDLSELKLFSSKKSYQSLKPQKQKLFPVLMEKEVLQLHFPFLVKLLFVWKAAWFFTVIVLHCSAAKIKLWNFLQFGDQQIRKSLEPRGNVWLEHLAKPAFFSALASIWISNCDLTLHGERTKVQHPGFCRLTR